MIKVNLLGKKGKNAGGIPYIGAIEAMGIPVKQWAAVLVIIYGVGWYIDGLKQELLKEYDTKINAVTQQMTELTNKAAKYNSLKGTIEKVQAEKAAYAAKFNIINRLISGRDYPVKMLETLTKLIPPQIWLKGVTVSNKVIKFDGNSMEFSYISDFHKALTESIFFEQVELGATNNSPDPLEAGKTIENFSLTMKMKEN